MMLPFECWVGMVKPGNGSITVQHLSLLQGLAYISYHIGRTLNTPYAYAGNVCAIMVTARRGSNTVALMFAFRRSAVLGVIVGFHYADTAVLPKEQWFNCSAAWYRWKGACLTILKFVHFIKARDAEIISFHFTVYEINKMSGSSICNLSVYNIKPLANVFVLSVCLLQGVVC